MNKNIVLVGILSIFLLGCEDRVGFLGIGGNDPKKYHSQNTGASSRDMLQNSSFKSLRVEVLCNASAVPTDQTLTNIERFLNTYLNKSEGIQVLKRIVELPQTSPLSITQIQSIEDDFRVAFNQGDTLAINILFLDAAFSEGNVLGVAYKNTSLALFAQTINENSGGIGQPSQTLLETTVFNHELGHLMGMVNIGTPLQSNHQDTPRGAHCNNQDCLMYYAVETTDVIANLIGLAAAPDFDNACKADLKANGGK